MKETLDKTTTGETPDVQLLDKILEQLKIIAENTTQKVE